MTHRAPESQRIDADGHAVPRGSAQLKSRIPGASCTYSKAPDRWPSGTPRYATDSMGALLRGSDDRWYIDYTSALGAVILGYRHPVVERAAIAQLQKGVSFSLATEWEETVADRLCRLTGMDMARFAKNGSDVTNAAVRIARAVTGRDRIVMLGDGYNGSADSFVTRGPKNGGIPSATKWLTLFCDRHDTASLERALAKEAACVILEPVLSSDPVPPPAYYFDRVRDLCDAYGALLILDEMVTGFRLGHPGGLCRYDIKPDLVCYGKALANGFPLSVLLGKEAYMRRIERDVFMSSTFGGEAVSLAAANATLDVLETESVAEQLERLGSYMIDEYAMLARLYGQDTYLYGYAARPMMHWNDPTRKARFLEALVDRGVLCQGYMNLTLAHTDENIRSATTDAWTYAFERVSARRAA